MSREHLRRGAGGQLAAHSDGPRLTPGPRHTRDPRPGPDGAAGAIPAAGQPGHGRTASLRLQPTCLAEGLMEDGSTAVYEVICRDCGDYPHLGYFDVSPRLQQIRGPYTMAAGLAAFLAHLGRAG